MGSSRISVHRQRRTRPRRLGGSPSSLRPATPQVVWTFAKSSPARIPCMRELIGCRLPQRRPLSVAEEGGSVGRMQIAHGSLLRVIPCGFPLGVCTPFLEQGAERASRGGPSVCSTALPEDSQSGSPLLSPSLPHHILPFNDALMRNRIQCVSFLSFGSRMRPPGAVNQEATSNFRA
jgi:hypothetical protein